MNGKKLSNAQYYTYEARKKDVRWLHSTIELLLEQSERGRNEEIGELFTNETIEVAKKLLELIETETPQSEDISELYSLLKFYKGVRNSDWDNICTHVEKWHWVANIWDNFEGILELDLWKGVEFHLYSIAKPLISEGKFLRLATSVGCYGHVWLRIEPKIKQRNIQIFWQINDDKIIPFYYIPTIFEAIIDGIIDYFRKTNIALTGIKIIIDNGSYHDVDSRSIDYRIAVTIAWRKAMANAELIPYL
ncbi:translation elongation factor EF-G [Anabaenopsis circularis NIES-21]|uniref:Translation elongation factor EF-G n=1 Tax=Anabaenopsis circularis NIES-21 TaxID=1085406 RepID=A0A1Z4GB53_9CYAN|nr:translation elongation factor EF-G [Anabaenopsis circularis NIES-21]